MTKLSSSERAALDTIYACDAAPWFVPLASWMSRTRRAALEDDVAAFFAGIDDALCDWFPAGRRPLHELHQRLDEAWMHYMECEKKEDQEAIADLIRIHTLQLKVLKRFEDRRHTARRNLPNDVNELGPSTARDVLTRCLDRVEPDRRASVAEWMEETAKHFDRPWSPSAPSGG